MYTNTHSHAHTHWTSVQRTLEIFSVGTKWALDKNKNPSVFVLIISRLSQHKHTRSYIQERRQFGHINLTMDIYGNSDDVPKIMNLEFETLFI